MLNVKFNLDFGTTPRAKIGFGNRLKSSTVLEHNQNMDEINP